MSTNNDFYPTALVDYLRQVGCRESESLQRIRLQTATLDAAPMSISVEQGAWLGWLVTALGVERAIEIGTFGGYSAAAIAESLPESGQLLCCEINPDYAQFARQAWQQAGLSAKIKCEVAPALDTLAQLTLRGDQFDLAFIDADKTNYLAYYQRLLPLLKPRGVMVFDNVLWHGKVWDKSQQQDSTLAIRQLNEFVQQDASVAMSLLPLGDGLLMVCKRG
jgi:predicted O-methyltransferase YrrM